MEEESAKEKFREILLLPPFYRGEDVDQALREYEDKIHRFRLSKSLMKVRGNLKESDQLLLLKRERMKLNHDSNGIFQEDV